MKAFIKNNKKIIIKILITLIVTLLMAATCYVLEFQVFKYTYKFTKPRLLIYFVIYAFTLFNILWDYRKIWNWIYKYRYLVALILFAVLVALGVNTSSAGIYAQVIQPSNIASNQLPFWGISQGIRSDEFLANTPVLLSQSFHGDFNTINPYVMGTDTSVLMFPKATAWDISILTNPQLIGFFFLGTARGFSFASLFPIFVSFLGVFELLLIMTKQKKIISLFGTCLIVFSPALTWWNATNNVAYYSICVVLFYKLLDENKIWKKIIYTICIGWAFSCTIAIMYPAWLVPFGYMFLGIAVWAIYDKRKTLKIRNFIYIPFSVLIAILIIAPAFIGSQKSLELLSNTVYPGARECLGGLSWEPLFNWMSSPFYTLCGTPNSCELSTFISIYPIPMLLGIYFTVKSFIKKDIDVQLMILTLVAILLNIWNFISIGIFAKITLLSMSSLTRAAIVVGAVNVFIIVRIISNYESNSLNIKRVFVAVLFAIIMLPIGYIAISKYIPKYTENKIVLIAMMGLSLVLIVLFVINSKKTNKIFMGLNIFISVFVIATILPLSFGLNSIYGKDVSNKIQEVSTADNQGKWISLNATLYYSNFALANGAKVINSVNFYPNMDLWKKIDPDKKYEKIYNRYAHIIFNTTNEETSFKLVQPDVVQVNLNIKDYKKLDIKYIYSAHDNIDKLSNSDVHIEKIYGNDNSYIYKIDYKNSQ